MNTIYTVGYNAGWTPQALHETAKRLHAMVIDTRLDPVSRRADWREPALRALMGRDYIHLPQLGNVNHATPGAPIELLDFKGVVSDVVWTLTYHPIILLCGCRDHAICHRTVVAKKLAKRTESAVEHLTAPTGIPALSVLQPWASLVAIRAKLIETRSWSTPYRGRLAIHASAGLPPGGAMELGALCSIEPFWSALRGAGFASSKELPRGKVIATCDLVDVFPTDLVKPGTKLHTTRQDGTRILYDITDAEYSFGDYTPGRFAWLLDNIQPLDEPQPAKGSLGLWTWIPTGALTSQAA